MVKCNAFDRSSVFPKTKAFARKHGVDLAIPNCAGSGIGNALMYTRLVEDWSRMNGRPATIATAPLNPSIGHIAGEDGFAIWRNNPFISKVLNGSDLDPKEFTIIDEERRSLVHSGHIINNIGFAYGVKPRTLRPSIYLSHEEMKWAMNALSNCRRPLICLHPGGNSKSDDGSFWAIEIWKSIIKEFSSHAGLFQIGRKELGDRDVGLANPATSLRETMALIWASDIFVGFDSAPMHIATAFEKPVISLFDMEKKVQLENKYGTHHAPSVILRWAYPQNINIAIMYNDKEVAHSSLCNKLHEIIYSLTYSI
ncbi:glycosyltransferase family 9 protein, partial [Endothiovibrio diazotrophicus]